MYYKNKYTDKLIKSAPEVKHGGRTDVQFNGAIDKIIYKIADEEGLSIGEVKKIVGSIFRFTDLILSKIKTGFFGKLSNTDNLPIIKYKYIGKFKPSPFRIKKMLKMLELKKKKQ